VTRARIQQNAKAGRAPGLFANAKDKTLRPEKWMRPPCRAGWRSKVWPGRNVTRKGELAIASKKGEAAVVNREAEQ